jgi:hypothetical protein
MLEVVSNYIRDELLARSGPTKKRDTRRIDPLEQLPIGRILPAYIQCLVQRFPQGLRFRAQVLLGPFKTDNRGRVDAGHNSEYGRKIIMPSAMLQWACAPISRILGENSTT